MKNVKIILDRSCFEYDQIADDSAMFVGPGTGTECDHEHFYRSKQRIFGN